MAAAAAAQHLAQKGTSKLSNYKMPTGGETVMLFYNRTLPGVQKDPAKKAPPSRITGYVMQTVEIKFIEEETGDMTNAIITNKLPNKAKPKTIMLEAFKSMEYFKSFTPPLNMVPGNIYELRGVVAESFQKDATTEYKSFKVGAVVLSPKTFGDFIDKIPFENKSLVYARDCVQPEVAYDQSITGALVAIQIENNIQRLTALLEAPGPKFVGTFNAPNKADTQFYQRDTKEGKTKIALNGGKDGQITHKPVINAMQRMPDGTVQEFCVAFGGYEDDFLPFMLPLEAW